MLVVSFATSSLLEKPASRWVMPPRQLDLLTEKSPAKDKTSSTFLDNLSLPIHRWYRYSAGFSATWAATVISESNPKKTRRVLDPFAGSGTVLLEAERLNAEAIGVEAHPFVCRVARAKLTWRLDSHKLHQVAEEVLRAAQAHRKEPLQYPSLIHRCYPESALDKLHALKMACYEHADKTVAGDLVWLALASTLRECSPVGTAQWQYVLPNKSKARVADPFTAFRQKIDLMCSDMQERQSQLAGPPARIFPGDARDCQPVSDGWANLVITSPPYANNYDYADATRLEMSFFGEIDSWGDLHSAVRTHLVRSCTQHVASLRLTLEAHLREPALASVLEELRRVCADLAEVRESHGGRKPYHLMIAAYFADLSRCWCALRRVCARGSKVCFVIGDSAPYGVYVPVDRWLGELAVAAGFRSYRFEKTRDRNLKWKNRKHRVPLHEGRLWVEG